MNVTKNYLRLSESLREFYTITNIFAVHFLDLRKVFQIEKKQERVWLLFVFQFLKEKFQLVLSGKMVVPDFLWRTLLSSSGTTSNEGSQDSHIRLQSHQLASSFLVSMLIKFLVFHRLDWKIRFHWNQFEIILMPLFINIKNNLKFCSFNYVP